MKDNATHIKKKVGLILQLIMKNTFSSLLNGEHIIAVGLGEKDLMWNLFDFFKVFFVAWNYDVYPFS